MLTLGTLMMLIVLVRQWQGSAVEVPKSGPQLDGYLDAASCICVTKSLHIPTADDVDAHAALSGVWTL